MSQFQHIWKSDLTHSNPCNLLHLVLLTWVFCSLFDIQSLVFFCCNRTTPLGASIAKRSETFFCVGSKVGHFPYKISWRGKIDLSSKWNGLCRKSVWVVWKRDLERIFKKQSSLHLLIYYRFLLWMWGAHLFALLSKHQIHNGHLRDGKYNPQGLRNVLQCISWAATTVRVKMNLTLWINLCIRSSWKGVCACVRVRVLKMWEPVTSWAKGNWLRWRRERGIAGGGNPQVSWKLHRNVPLPLPSVNQASSWVLLHFHSDSSEKPIGRLLCEMQQPSIQLESILSQHLSVFYSNTMLPLLVHVFMLREWMSSRPAALHLVFG